MTKPRQGLDPLLSEAIIGTIREPMIVLGDDLRVIVASASFYKTFNTSAEDTLDKLFHELGNGQWDVPLLRTMLEEVISRRENLDSYEVTHDFEDIGTRTMVINAREIVYKNDIKKMLVSIHDITDRRKVEEDKDRLMKQKDTLLLEMRHRIANSLQLIASVILLKAGSVKSEESRLHLQDAHERILSIATVQRNLDPVGDDHAVPVVEYLTTLCASIAKSMVGGRKPITIEVRGGSGTVSPDEAISMGLITTELVINALKHAFPGNEGEIKISFDSDSTGWKLAIADDGIGLTAAKTEDTTDGLGSSIVESLANQLNAIVKRESPGRGTLVTIIHKIGMGINRPPASASR